MPFREWLDELKDRRSRAAIDARLLRLRLGNFGDSKSVGGGVRELRVHRGPGFRVYFAEDGDRIVVLLLGGVKGTQSADIRTAKRFWVRYQEAQS